MLEISMSGTEIKKMRRKDRFAPSKREESLLILLDAGILAVYEIAVLDDLLERHAVEGFDLRITFAVCGHFLQHAL